MLAGGATDLLDGWLARRLNQRSNIGRIMDPVIDKLAILAVVFYLIISPLYTYPLWYFLVQLIRECMILLGGLFIAGRIKKVVESRMSGKVSALANGLVVLLYIFNIRPVQTIFLVIALGLTVYSTAEYVQIFLEILKDSKNQPEPTIQDSKQELHG
jgi:CDP-diacylglycerol--glycerol-3-phosphate 3-phosphatidyltransferase